MPRPPALLAAVVASFAAAPVARADAFDHYTNPVLAKAVNAGVLKEIKELTEGDVLDNDRVLPGVSAAFLMVKTNEGRNARLLVSVTRQKTPGGELLPVLLIERYVTYKEGEERAVLASGQNVALYDGFRLSLDRGQVVPEALGGDLTVRARKGSGLAAVPLGKARLFLVAKPLPDAGPRKGPKPVVGEKFEPRYYNGTYQLYDDGRRSGRLTLRVDEEGCVSGTYYSDRDGRKYEVRGKVGTPPHSVQFTVKLPRVEQTFQGWLFTGDARALTGSSRLGEREAGFYAVRIE